MFKIKIQSVFVIALLCFTSCVSTNISSKGKTPSWVTETEHEYTKNNLCAVGIATTLDQANSIAISNIGKIIKQKIESEITVVNSEKLNSTGNAELSSSINQIVRTSALIDNLVGVEIAETWIDRDGNYYSLAILNKAKTYLYYSQKISENEKIIKENINLTTSDKDKFYIYGKLQNAVNLALDNESYLDVIYAVNKASYTVTAKTMTKSNDIENIASDFARKISITISGLENEERTKNYFYKYFTSKGFSVNAPQQDYVFEIDMKIENTSSGELYYARYNFSANLKDLQTDSIIYSYSASERIAHKTIAEANQKTILRLEKKLNKEFDSDFINSMNAN